MWLPIKDYPDYEISIDGFVRNITTNRVLKHSRIRNQVRVTLCGKSKPTAYAVHRLVASHFLEPHPTATKIEFINGDITDVRAANLRWRVPAIKVDRPKRKAGRPRTKPPKPVKEPQPLPIRIYWRIVPGYSRYMVSTDNRLETADGDRVPFCGSSSYRVSDDEGVEHVVKPIQLRALAFPELPSRR